MKTANMTHSAHDAVRIRHVTQLSPATNIAGDKGRFIANNSVNDDADAPTCSPLSPSYLKPMHLEKKIPANSYLFPAVIWFQARGMGHTPSSSSVQGVFSSGIVGLFIKINLSASF